MTGTAIWFGPADRPCFGWVHPPADGRVTGFGVMANANLIAAAMGAGFLWLWPWRFQTPGRRALKWLAMAVMVACLVLADSRSAWAALFAAIFVLLAIRNRERAWRRLIEMAGRIQKDVSGGKI